MVSQKTAFLYAKNPKARRGFADRRYQLWPERVARSLWQGVTAPGVRLARARHRR
jgi:hypothetical protein